MFVLFVVCWFSVYFMFVCLYCFLFWFCLFSVCCVCFCLGLIVVCVSRGQQEHDGEVRVLQEVQ